MTVTFYTNYVNHHQMPLADEIYRILGESYRFVEIRDTEELVKAMSGYSVMDRPYIIRPAKSEQESKLAMKLATDSDIVIWDTPDSLPYAIERYKKASNKITFEISERWLKRGLINLLSPRLLRNKWVYYTKSPKRNTFMLCQSAFVPNDEYLMGCYRNRCYKFAYFTAVKEIEIDSLIANKKKRSSPVKILSVARFLWWKYPERMVYLAEKLRLANVEFVIDMVGEGPKFDFVKGEINRLGLQEFVRLVGVMPNAEVTKKMQEYDIFCFTSDRNEGWGTVLNEAMSNGCCPVACKDIGSAPYLIKDGENGLLFDDHKEDDLFEKVLWLIDNPEERYKMSVAAYNTMYELWNPKVAACRLIELCENLLTLGNRDIFTSGPLSIALPCRK